MGRDGEEGGDDGEGVGVKTQSFTPTKKKIARLLFLIAVN
jgi:hypothetical protein